MYFSDASDDDDDYDDDDDIHNDDDDDGEKDNNNYNEIGVLLMILNLQLLKTIILMLVTCR